MGRAWREWLIIEALLETAADDDDDDDDDDDGGDGGGIEDEEDDFPLCLPNKEDNLACMSTAASAQCAEDL